MYPSSLSMLDTCKLHIYNWSLQFCPAVKTLQGRTCFSEPEPFGCFVKKTTYARSLIVHVCLQLKHKMFSYGWVAQCTTAVSTHHRIPHGARPLDNMSEMNYSHTYIVNGLVFLLCSLSHILPLVHTPVPSTGSNEGFFLPDPGSTSGPNISPNFKWYCFTITDYNVPI